MRKYEFYNYWNAKGERREGEVVRVQETENCVFDKNRLSIKLN